MKLITSLMIIFLILFAYNAFASEKLIILATTTSLENSGLLSHILPLFEKKTGIKVKVIARGTGAAIDWQKRRCGCCFCPCKGT